VASSVTSYRNIYVTCKSPTLISKHQGASKCWHQRHSQSQELRGCFWHQQLQYTMRKEHRYILLVSPLSKMTQNSYFVGQDINGTAKYKKCYWAAQLSYHHSPNNISLEAHPLKMFQGIYHCNYPAMTWAKQVTSHGCMSDSLRLDRSKSNSYLLKVLATEPTNFPTWVRPPA
jgi:hypothetical protein